MLQQLLLVESGAVTGRSFGEQGLLTDPCFPPKFNNWENAPKKQRQKETILHNGFPVRAVAATLLPLLYRFTTKTSLMPTETPEP